MTLLNKFPKSWLDEEAKNVPIILEACQIMLDRVMLEINRCHNGLSITNSEGDYLDENGNDFEIPRYVGESDNAYRARLSGELIKRRNTVHSIMSALNRIQSIGNAVYQPYENLFTVGESELSGEDQITDYGYWDFHVVDVLTRIDPRFIEYTLQRLIAAGKTLYITHINDIIALCKPDEIKLGGLWELQLHYKSIPAEADFAILSMEFLFGLQGIVKEDIFRWTACRPFYTSLVRFENGAPDLSLQMGYQIKNETEGVDY